MNRPTAFLFATVLTCGLAGCSVASPDAGHAVVWVEKPWFFGHGGVDSNIVTTGRSFGALTSDAIDVNMLPQRVDMEFDDMMTKSGVPVSFHVVLAFKITDPVRLVTQFGADRIYYDWQCPKDKDGNAQCNGDPDGWGFFNRNLDQPIRTAVRDSVKKRDMQEMAIDQTAADAVGQEVSVAANKIVLEAGIPIMFPPDQINVGRVNPPDAIKNQRIETAAQEQRAITEQQTKLAEDQRKAAETSRASADNAYREAMGLSPEQFILLEQIKMQRDVCGKEGTCTFFVGGSPVPTLNVRK
jgi:hypothetical protein